MVVEKPIQFQTGRTDTLINPCFIAKVLSKSTQDYDHGEKFAAYRTLPSFREYLMINQYTMHVEQYINTAPNQWLLSEYHNPSDTIRLNMFDLEIRLTELYEGIELNLPLS